MSKKISCLILIFSFVFSMLLPCNTVLADNEPIITIDTVNSINGDSFIVNANIKNNPGIMAITISFTYDSDALEYERYYRGFLSDYTVADHPDKGIIRFVNCESRNRNDNGNLISLQFKVKENAKAEFYKISIDYSKGDFSNWNMNNIMPEIISGGVEVSYNGKNCPHKEYSDWIVVVPPTCIQTGMEKRVCKRCGHTEYRDIPKTEHDFSDDWYIDIPATDSKQGEMSRHCKICGARTDIIKFSKQQCEENNINNNVDVKVPESDFTKSLMTEQHKETESNTEALDSSDTVELKDNKKGDIKDKSNSSDSFKNSKVLLSFLRFFINHKFLLVFTIIYTYFILL